MPPRAPEFELKFTAPADLAPDTLALEAGIASVTELPHLILVAVYYDTDDLRLARAGVTLRYRSGDSNGADGWTLKLPAMDKAELRDEVQISGPNNGVPEEARRLVTVFTRGAVLAKVAKLRTRRRRWSLRQSDGGELAELVDDSVSVLYGRRVTQRFRELELEARTEDHAGLKVIEATLSQMGFVHSPPVPKAVRALGARAALPSDVPEPAPVSPRSPAADAVAAGISAAVRRLMLNDPYARMHEPEGIHQMRVSGRRLRSNLRTFGALVQPEWAQDFISELRWLARLLGAVRDLDVLLGKLVSAHDLEGELKPLHEALDQQQAAARQALDEALASDRYIALIERLIQAARAPAVTAAASESCRSALPRLVGETWRPLADAVSELSEVASDDAYHQVRIHAKRARYAAEAAAPCLGRRAGNDAVRFAQHAEEVQNILGQRQDAVVFRQALLDEAARRAGDANFNLAAGRLSGRQDQTIAASDDGFREEWRALKRKKIRAWLNQ